MKIEGDTITFKSTLENFNKELMSKTNTVRKFYVDSAEYDEFLKNKSKLENITIWRQGKYGEVSFTNELKDISKLPSDSLYDYSQEGYLIFRKVEVWVFSW